VIRQDGNNFDLLRFVLASIVLLVHTHVLTNNAQLHFLSQYLSPDYAVKAFFVISGFLIFKSYDQSGSIRDFFEKRARRIYPAYAAIVMLCAAAGAAITTLPLNEYFSGSLAKYVLANLALLNFLAPDLPGVFTGNPMTTVNGVLWTIKVEVMFYCSVPVLAYLFRRFGIALMALITYAGSITYCVVLSEISTQTGNELYQVLARQLPGQLAYFVTGAFLLYQMNRLRRWLPFAAAVAAVMLPLRLPVVHVVIEPFLLGCLVIYLAMGICYLGNFGRYGDLSYGIYIVHFPAIQLLVSLGAFTNPWIGLSGTIAVVLLGAWCSWHFVERPFLRRASHYVVAAAR
jgi:peptidoglycan/LPS O-acetylase OafA/YrhL